MSNQEIWLGVLTIVAVVMGPLVSYLLAERAAYKVALETMDRFRAHNEKHDLERKQAERYAEGCAVGAVEEFAEALGYRRQYKQRCWVKIGEEEK